MARKANPDSLLAEYAGDYQRCYERGLLAIIDGRPVVPFQRCVEQLTEDERVSLGAYVDGYALPPCSAYYARYVERWLAERAAFERSRVAES